jgi:hypothetical protein
MLALFSFFTNNLIKSLKFIFKNLPKAKSAQGEYVLCP